MTSRECYVYITLPNQYEQVTAGKFVLETNTRGENIGRFANKYKLTSEAERFLLTKDEALGIIDEMYKTISQSWYKVARSAGVNENDCDKIKTAFCYEGFNYNIK